MPRATTPSFIIELPLKTNSQIEKVLLKRLDCARQIMNACTGESLKRLRLMRESKAFRNACKMPKGKERTEAFKAVNEKYQFKDTAIQRYAIEIRHSWLGEHIDSATTQKIASRAFKPVANWSFGKGGKPRFKGKNQMDSVESKSNNSGIRWKEDRIFWFGLEIPAIMPKRNNNGEIKDKVLEHGLGCRTKYCRIVRRKIRGRNRFYVQLIVEGDPYRKEKNFLGTGDVGIDIGPSTIAIVSEKEAHLEQFCAGLEWNRKEIRRLQRKLDRQRRANNPENFNDNGTVKKGRKTWHDSNNYLKTKAKLEEAHRLAAAHRKQMHGELVNDILRMGETFKFEKLSYVAFQKMFGKSVGMRAPGMFISMLKSKAVRAGGNFIEFGTRATKFSQLCHNCGTIKKKPLSQRWHSCECGVVAQRDLYSAFLAMCLEDERLNGDYAFRAWSGVESRLWTALSETESASAKRSSAAPTSFGLSQSQSRLSTKSKRSQSEVRDVVPIQNIGWREPAKAMAGFGTPRL